MKNKLILIFSVCILSSCGNSTDKPGTNSAAGLATMALAADEDAKVKKDPVCEMPYDSAWTEQTVYQKDTIRFCSEQCKSAFLARPAKYTKR